MLTRKILDDVKNELEWHDLLKAVIDEAAGSSHSVRVACGDTHVAIALPANKAPLIDALQQLLAASEKKLADMGYEADSAQK